MDTIDDNIDPSVTTVCYKEQMKILKTSPTDPNLTESLQKQLEMERKLNDYLEMEGKFLQFRHSNHGLETKSPCFKLLFTSNRSKMPFLKGVIVVNETSLDV